MNKKKIPVLSLVLYVLSGLLVIYTVWSAASSFKYISEMVSQGQLVISGNKYNIANFYMSNCGQYAAFAVILFTLGWILQKSSSGVATKFNVENNAENVESNVENQITLSEENQNDEKIEENQNGEKPEENQTDEKNEDDLEDTSKNDDK